MLALMDTLRRAQGETLELFGFGPRECPYRVLASGLRWRLRAYIGPDAGPALVIVPAPIKRPYIWDLAAGRSAVRYCLGQDLRVYLLEWLPPSAGHGNAGLAEYAHQAIGEALAAVSLEAHGTKPFLMGHSLGGTFAAIFAALEPDSVQGLVLLSAPLCFEPGTSEFRDALVAMAPSGLAQMDLVPGSLLSQLSALASPRTFVWSRLMDGALSLADPEAAEICARVERWALDEVPLPGKLVHQVLEWLYRQNRFYAGTLPVRNRTVGPPCLRLPTLAVINTQDELAPLASVVPFLHAIPGPEARLIEYSGEPGVGLQHLAILVGRQAYAWIWPNIVSWLNTVADRSAQNAMKRRSRTRSTGPLD